MSLDQFIITLLILFGIMSLTQLSIKIYHDYILNRIAQGKIKYFNLFLCGYPTLALVGITGMMYVTFRVMHFI